MDRLELRKQFSGRIHSFKLDDSIEVHIRELTALERAKLVDKYRVLEKSKDADNALETLTVEAQCFIASRGLVDEHGARIYSDDEAAKLAEEFPCKLLDRLSLQILTVSGLLKPQDETIKNSETAPNDSFSYALQ